MIYVSIQANTRPDLKALYTHADVRVWGVPFFICVAPVYWQMGSMRPGISTIGNLESEWKWHLNADGMHAYRVVYPGKHEHLSIEEWAERQLEEAPSALFGAGVGRG